MYLENINNKTPLKIVGQLRCFGSVTSSCSTSGTRRVPTVFDQ